MNLPTEKYYYRGNYYIWKHEPQNLYKERHITIYDAVRAINYDSNPRIQDGFDPPRWMFVGIGSYTAITVITDDSWTRIITAWNSSADEIKHLLQLRPHKCESD